MAEKIIAFIPVRGGSKSISGKNIKLLAGKPLVHWVVEAALACNEINKVYIATDCDKIRQSLNSFAGLSKFSIFNRGAETATDDATTESAMLEFAHQYEFDQMVLIQATSPLLTTTDLEKGIARVTSGYDSLLSVVKQKRFVWSEAQDGQIVPQNYNLDDRPRRQDFSGYWVENGAFYITNRKALLGSHCRLSGRIGYLEMAEESYLELDEPSDWIAVEQLLQQKVSSHMDLATTA